MAIALTPIILAPNVSQTIILKSPGVLQAIKLSNGSPFDLTVSGFGVNGQEIIPAGTEHRLYADVYNSGDITVLPVNNVGVTATGVLNIVLYQAGEQLPPGNWPVTIPAQVINAKVSTVTSLVNDGSAAGTQIIESTVSGDSASAVSLTNDAHLTLGDVAHPATVTIVGSAANITVLATGELDVANKLGVNLMNALTGNDMTFGVATGHKFAFQINSSDVWDWSATGLQIQTNAAQKIITAAGGALFDASAGTDLTLNAPNTGGGHFLNLQVGGTTFLHGDGTSTFFKVGQLARIAMGFSAVVTTGTSISHGLGVTPTAIFVCPSGTSVSFNVSSPGASTFTVTVSANVNVWWLALATT